MGKPRPDGLDEAGILTALRGKRNATRDDCRRSVVESGKRHHHRRETFIAGRNTHHSFAGRQRTGEAPEDNCGIVTIGKGVKHPRCALRTAITWVADKARKWRRALLAEAYRGGSYLEADFPVTGVVAEGDRFAIVVAEPAESREDKVFILRDRARFPAHPDVLCEAKQVTAGPVEQHVLGEGESACGAIGGCRDIEERVVLSHAISVTNPWIQNVCSDDFDDGSGHTVTVISADILSKVPLRWRVFCYVDIGIW